MVLETTVCVDLLREGARSEFGPARRALSALGDSRVFLSLFTVCELQTGALLSARRNEEQRRVAELVQRCTVLYPDGAFATLYAETAAALLRAGNPIPVMDLLIGVCAKAHGLPLLTRDLRHFELIPGLAVEGYGESELSGGRLFGPRGYVQK